MSEPGTDSDSDAAEEPWAKLLEEVAEAMKETTYRMKLIEYRTIDLVRRSGKTWNDIAEGLGITRQAVAQKYHGGEPRRDTD